MPDHDEIRIRKSTNLYDLLDDGIANNSDISELVRRECAIAAQAPSPAKPERGLIRPFPIIVGTARNWLGIALGLLAVIAGSAVAFHPVAMLVWHSRMRLPSFFEYVGIERARGYGICVAIFGLLLLAYSLVKMPVSDKES